MKLLIASFLLTLSFGAFAQQNNCAKTINHCNHQVETFENAMNNTDSERAHAALLNV